MQTTSWKRYCEGYGGGRVYGSYGGYECTASSIEHFDKISGGFGGFNRSLELTSLPPDSLPNEFIAFSMCVDILAGPTHH